MYNPIFFSRRGILKTKEGDREVFLNIWPDIKIVKCFGPPPYYKLTFTESENHDGYYAWKDFEAKEYGIICFLKEMIEICFAYRTKAEEERNKGKLVRLVIKEYEKIESFP